MPEVRGTIDIKGYNPEGVEYYHGKSAMVELPDWVVSLLEEAHEGTFDIRTNLKGVKEVFIRNY